MPFLNNSVQQPGVQELGNLFLSVTGGKVLYVGTAAQIANLGDVGAGITGRTFTDVNTALGQCVSGRGDIIYVLPGYTETIAGSAWTNAATINDVRIIGLGHGTNRPTFTWTATGSQIAISSANFSLQNCVLNLAGTAATSTVKAIVVTGAGSIIDNCYIVAGAAGGSQVATIAIEYGTGADKATFSNNEMNAPADAACVSCLKIVAAIDRFRMINNVVDVGMSATGVGVCTMTVAPTNAKIAGNSLRNGITNSTKALVAIAGASGYVENNMCYIMAATGAGAAIGTPGALQCNQNFGQASTTNTTGILTPNTAAT